MTGKKIGCGPGDVSERSLYMRALEQNGAGSWLEAALGKLAEALRRPHPDSDNEGKLVS